MASRAGLVPRPLEKSQEPWYDSKLLTHADTGFNYGRGRACSVWQPWSYRNWRGPVCCFERHFYVSNLEINRRWKYMERNRYSWRTNWYNFSRMGLMH